MLVVYTEYMDEIEFKNSYKITETGCWEWQKALTSDGYGRVQFNKKQQQAHRVSYELFVSSIPDGFHVDHLCRNRSCINPKHLEAVSQLENTLRGRKHNKWQGRQSPGTPIRAIRIPDDIWLAARDKSNEENTTLTKIIMNYLKEYIQ